MKSYISHILFFLLIVFNSWAQEKQISGNVIGEGDALPGVNVTIKNTTKGTMTDFDGNYTIKAKETDVLVFSYLGFKSQEVLVGKKTTINVTLETDFTDLDEVIVVGYGSVKKRDLTGAVATVKGADIAKRTMTNIQESLSGQMPGVQVTSSGGQPGAEPSITIRGLSTLNDNSPLYVVDGVALDDIGFLSPRDVESIQVLKDASASAIFGSRASNGVVIITTKKAKSGRTTISLDASSSIQSFTKSPDLANGTQYAQIINQARINDGDSPLYTNPESFGEGTDWWDLISQVAPMADMTLNFAKGSDNMKISAGFGYQTQEGVQIGSDFNKLNTRLNTEYKISERITIGQNFTLGKTKTTDGPNLIWDVHRLEPITNPYLPDYEQTGRNEFSIFSPTITDVPNAMGVLARNFNESDYLRGLATAYINWEIIDGLTFKSQYSVYFSTYENNWFAPDYFIEENDKLQINSVGRTHNNRTNTTFNNTLTYTKELDKHNFTVMAGTIFEDLEHRTLYASADNIPSNHPDLRFLDAATESFLAYGNNENYNLMSYIGRLNYSFDSKYLLTATVRVDGSSLFPDSNKWGTFPSVSAAWVLSNESFLADSNWINQLKLRAGWGQIGNDNRNSIPNSARLTTIGNDYYTSGSGQNLIIGTGPSNVGNPDIKWETVEDLNFGIDLSVFNSKLGVTVDVFRRVTRDMLMAKSIPSYLGSGYDAQWSNVGSFKTNGFDLGITYNDTYGNVGANFSLNISKYNAIAEELADGEAIWDGNHQRLDLLSYTMEGETPGLFYGYVTDGIFQNRTEINSHSDEFGSIIQPFAQPGDFRFKDLNGDGMLTNVDRTIIGDPTPDFTFGFKMAFSYEGFDFSTLLTGSVGNDMLNAAKPYLMSGSGNYNSYASVLTSAWNGEGSSNSQPRLSNDDPNQNFRYSDYYIEDGSFLRVKNVQFGYSFNETTTEKIGLTKARLFISAENILTLTSFSGLDPEVGGYSTLRGVDWGHYPVPQIVAFGVNISF